jgi:hypothetical protein
MAKTILALIVSLCLALPAAAAQGKSEPKKTFKPEWTELTPEQQKVLAPLAAEWGRMDSTRRKKWVEIANRYPKMSRSEQQRLRKRMDSWARLTPEQRRAAREKYQRFRQLPPDKRKEVSKQWRDYQRSLAAQPDLSSSDGPAPPDTEAPDPTGVPQASQQ